MQCNNTVYGVPNEDGTVSKSWIRTTMESALVPLLTIVSLDGYYPRIEDEVNPVLNQICLDLFTINIGFNQMCKTRGLYDFLEQAYLESE